MQSCTCGSGQLKDHLMNVDVFEAATDQPGLSASYGSVLVLNVSREYKQPNIGRRGRRKHDSVRSPNNETLGQLTMIKYEHAYVIV